MHYQNYTGRALRWLSLIYVVSFNCVAIELPVHKSSFVSPQQNKTDLKRDGELILAKDYFKKHSIPEGSLITVKKNASGQEHVHVEYGSDDNVRAIIQFRLQPASNYIQSLQGAEKANVNSRKKTLNSHKSNIISYQKSLKATQQQFINSSVKNKLIQKVKRQSTHLSNMISVITKMKNLDALRELPDVKSVSLDTIYTPQLAESTEIIGVNAIWNRSDANGTAVTGQGVRVAIIDTGIDYTHPDLGGCFGANCKVSGGYDIANDDADPMDDGTGFFLGHGTHVAGIVAANGEVRGVAPDATLYAYKVCSAAGVCFGSDIIAALELAVDPDGDPFTDDGAHVINMSLGGPGSPIDSVSMAANAAVDSGTIVVAGAGNEGSFYTVTSPGLAEKVITVASSTKEDEISSFSSKGPVDGFNFLKPEIAAPGEDITSTFPGGSYQSLSGTSMASPHVAGAAALARQLFPDFTVLQVKSLLVNSATPLSFTHNDSNFELLVALQGAGRLDLNKVSSQTLVSDPQTIDFGHIETDSKQWSVEKDIVLTNFSLESQDVELLLRKTVPTGMTIQLSQNSFTIESGAQKTLKVTLTVDTEQLTYPNNIPMHFNNWIRAQTESSVLQIPLVVEHGLELNIFTETPLLGFQLWNDGNFRRYHTPGVLSTTNKLLVQPGIYNIFTQARATTSDMGLPTADIPQLINYFHLTEGNVISSDTNYNVSLDDALYKISLDDFIGEDGDNIGADKLRTRSCSRKLSHSLTGESLLFELQFFLKSWLPPLTVSNQFSDAFVLTEECTFQETEKDKVSSVFNLFYTKKGMNADVSHEINATTARMLNIPFNIPQFQDRIKLSQVQNQVGGYVPIDESKNSLNFFWNIDESYEGVPLAIVSLAATGEDFLDGMLADSLPFDVDMDNIIHFRDFNVDSGTTDIFTSRELPLNAQSLYWNGRVTRNSSDFKFKDELNSNINALTQDIWNTRYFAGQGTNYEIICDDEVVQSGGLGFKHWSDPNRTGFIDFDKTCQDVTMRLLFSGTHQNEPVESTIEILFPTTGLVTPQLYNLKLKNAGNVSNRINRIENLLSFNLSSGNASTIQVFVELKVADGDWQNIYESQQAGEHQMVLPLVQGSHSASLRISLENDAGVHVIQELNKFLTIGNEAGDVVDADGDGVTDDIDVDDDNDGVSDESDAFPLNPNEWDDTDEDGTGNNTDEDDDNDGVLDGDDEFPLDATESVDTDKDGIGNNADDDDDGDGILDGDDAFPLDASESVDTDEDGIGNNADLDDDGDGVSDTNDAFPLDASESVDTDNDGIGNNADTDDDGDGVSDNNDAFPLDPSRSEQPPANISSGGGGGPFTSFWMLCFVLYARKKWK